MGQWIYEYDALGNLRQQTDAKADITCFYYDSLNRLTDKAYQSSGCTATAPVSPFAHYDYDQGSFAKGQRTKMTDEAGSVSWSYDARGRLLQAVRTFSGDYDGLENNVGNTSRYTTTYQYNQADWVTGLAYPDGEVVSTSYTRRGLADELDTNIGDPYISSASYNDLAQMTAQTARNDLVTTYTYYSGLADNNRLKRIQVGILLDVTYDSYDQVGNISQITDDSASINGQTLTFSYDHLDRLTAASAGLSDILTYTHSYVYDKIGNIDGKNIDGLYYDYTYPASGENSIRPHAVTSVGSDSYSYDAVGNMISRTEDSLTYTQDWTEFNKLERVSWSQGSKSYSTTFVYDGDGNRLLKIEDMTEGAGYTETTTLYLGQLYEREVDTTSDDLSDLTAFQQSEITDQMLAGLELTILGSHKAHFAPLLGAYTFSDEFATLDTSTWTVITNNISLVASSSPSQLEASRTSTYSADWGDVAHIQLKQGVNFLDDFDSTIEWKVQVDTGAERMVMHLRAEDDEAQRYIAFDCAVGDSTTADFTCNANIRDTSLITEPQLDYVVLTPTFARDTIHHFKLVYTGTRTVAFYHDGTWLTNITFSEADWNGIDWVRPEWLVLGWSGYTNTISAALDYFTFASDDDDPPPSLTLNAEPTTTSGAENTITWNGVTDPGYGGVTYQAVRATDAIFTTDLYTTTWQSEASATFTGLTDNTTYYYHVRAKDGLDNTTSWSNVVSSTQIVPPSGGEMSVRKYYYHGAQRVAMRQGNVVYYLHGDHLGSTSLTTSFTQSVVHEARYLPFGGERWSSGAGVTDFTYTGQRREGFQLHDYNARYYSSRLGRFTSPDSIVPNFANPQSLNRYSYVRNNPLKYIDPSGNFEECSGGLGNCDVQYSSPSGINDPVAAQNAIDSSGEFLGGVLTILPYFDTGEDIAVATSGCGLNCRMGYENSVGTGWRIVAGTGVIAPWGYRSVKTAWNTLTTIGDGVKKFDSVKLQKIIKALETENFGFVVGDEKAMKALRKFGAGAAYMRIGSESKRGIVIWPENPSRWSVIEELFHLGQHRKSGFVSHTGTRDQVLEEIRAQKYLLQHAHRFEFTPEEITQIETNLRNYMGQLNNLKR